MRMEDLIVKYGVAKLSRASGIGIGNLCNMMSGKRTIGLKVAETIAKSTGTQLHRVNGEWRFVGKPKLKGGE